MSSSRPGALGADGRAVVDAGVAFERALAEQESPHARCSVWRWLLWWLMRTSPSIDRLSAHAAVSLSVDLDLPYDLARARFDLGGADARLVL